MARKRTSSTTKATGVKLRAKREPALRKADTGGWMRQREAVGIETIGPGAAPRPDVQILADPAGQEHFAVVPIDAWRRTEAALEDAGDAARIAAGRAEPGLTRDQLDRLLAGVHPLRVWREARGLSVAGLAESAGVSVNAIRDIEIGRTEGRVRVLNELARVLELDIEDLLASLD